MDEATDLSTSSTYVQTAATGIAVFDPCYIQAGFGADTVHSGVLQANTGTNIVTQLNTLTSLTDTSKAFALCYSLDGINFEDSGIRVTTPKLTGVTFLDQKFGNPSSMPQYTRSMTSLVLTTNRIPNAPSQQLTYDGNLAAQKWISLVSMDLNGGYPCANPTVTAATADSYRSGSLRAGTTGTSYDQQTVVVPQTILLDKSKSFAVCYAEGDGNGQGDTLDQTWRDSYIRITMSEIASVIAYRVTHSVWGQIPNHAALKIDYTGSLSSGKYLILMDQQLGPITMQPGSTTQYSFPCQATSGIGADQQELSSAGSGATGTTVTIDTTLLNTELVFALCYADSLSQVGSFSDTGIRITVPVIYNMQADSKYSGQVDTTGVQGIPMRDQLSWDQIDSNTIIDRPTSRIARVLSQKVIYTTHPT